MRGYGLRGGIGQAVVEDCDRPLGALEQRVCGRGPPCGPDRVNERRDLRSPAAREPQDLAEVPPLGPAHVGERVIKPLLLVCRIVATGSIGSRR